jgi:uncharacterized hydrophobic protein (TIGR00271 family)
MTEKDYPQHIRYSYGIRLPRAIATSLSVMLVISSLVLMGDLLQSAGSILPLTALLLTVFIGLNLLAYLELSQSLPLSGGAYRLVQTSEEASWQSFLTGWMLILSGLAAAGLILQVFSQQAAALTAAVFNIQIPPIALAGGLLVLTGIYKLLPRRNKGITLAAFLPLAIILAGSLTAIPKIQAVNLFPLKGSWQAAFTTLLISFISLEVAAGLQGDLSKRNFHGKRLLWISVLLSGLITSLLAILLVGTFSSGYSSSILNPLADLAAVWGNRWFQIGLGTISLLAVPLALTRVISLLIRQVYNMTKDGYWPDGLNRINPRTKKPVILLVLVLALIIPTLFVDHLLLARLGSLFYLLVLATVNLTLARKDQLESSFQLPIHPWIPAMVMVFDLLVAIIWAKDILPAAVLLAAGLLLYFLYGRNHCIEVKEGITVFKSDLEEGSAKVHKRILVPISNPETAESLLHLAGSLVRPEGGKVIALRVITVPNQLPLSDGRIEAEANRMLLDQAIDQATKEEFRVQTMTRVSRTIAEGILDTAREEDVDQILVGWSGGESRSIAKSMGPVLDPIIKDAPCEVLIVKGFDWKEVKTILVPTSGGPNAPIGARLASTLSRSTGATVTGLYVQVGRASNIRMAQNRKVLDNTFQDLEFDKPPEKKIILANSVLTGILKEAENYDLVIVGASEEGFIDQFAFGSIPQRIAAQAPYSSVMVKGYSGAPEFWLRKVLQIVYNLFPTLSQEDQLEVREDLISDAEPGQDYFVLIVLSSIIAALGLLLNSPAVVIGAMLVAPLMSPILAFSLAIVLGEVRLLRTSLESVFKGVMATIIVSILVGLISPLKEMTPEILARIQPTLLDLFIAMASGMAGAYALSRKEVSAALPGVAIAAALAPPLSVVGLGIAFGNMQAAGGALLLFITNIITISLAGVIIFTLLGIHPLNLQPEVRKRVRRGITGMVLLVVLITIPLGIIMNGILRTSRQDQAIQTVLEKSPLLADITDLEIERTRSDQGLQISVTVRKTDPLTQQDVDALAEELKAALDEPLILDFTTLPVIYSR